MKVSENQNRPQSLPQLARIPAPPIFSITQAGPVITTECLNCNIPPPPPPPAPVQCSKEEGSPLPRCKREPPKGVKCKRTGIPLKVVGETDGDLGEDDDEECGEPDIKLKEEEGVACVDCNEPGKMETDDFNPKKLLEKLCTGGKCSELPKNALPPVRKSSGWMEPSTTGL